MELHDGSARSTRVPIFVIYTAIFLGLGKHDLSTITIYINYIYFLFIYLFNSLVYSNNIKTAISPTSAIKSSWPKGRNTKGFLSQSILHRSWSAGTKPGRSSTENLEIRLSKLFVAPRKNN